MPRFSRESGDVLDLPEMQRRGLIKFPEPEEQVQKNEEDFHFLDDRQNRSFDRHDEIDFTSSSSSDVGNVEHEVKKENFSVPEVNPSSSGVSNFLSDFASIGISNNSEVSKNEPVSVGSDSDATKIVQDLKWRLENTEYKLEQVMERLLILEKNLE